MASQKHFPCTSISCCASYASTVSLAIGFSQNLFLVFVAVSSTLSNRYLPPHQRHSSCWRSETKISDNAVEAFRTAIPLTNISHKTCHKTARQMYVVRHCRQRCHATIARTGKGQCPKKHKALEQKWFESKWPRKEKGKSDTGDTSMMDTRPGGKRRLRHVTDGERRQEPCSCDRCCARVSTTIWEHVACSPRQR